MVNKDLNLGGHQVLTFLSGSSPPSLPLCLGTGACARASGSVFTTPGLPGSPAQQHFPRVNLLPTLLLPQALGKTSSSGAGSLENLVCGVLEQQLLG